MKKKRFSVEYITAVLQQAEAGTPVGDLCRQVGISEQTFYRWKKQFAGLGLQEIRELRSSCRCRRNKFSTEGTSFMGHFPGFHVL